MDSKYISKPKNKDFFRFTPMYLLMCRWDCTQKQVQENPLAARYVWLCLKFPPYYCFGNSTSQSNSGKHDSNREALSASNHVGWRSLRRQEGTWTRCGNWISCIKSWCVVSIATTHHRGGKTSRCHGSLNPAHIPFERCFAWRIILHNDRESRPWRKAWFGTLWIKLNWNQLKIQQK